MAQYEDLRIDQGSDFKLVLDVLEADGSRKDLAGHTFQGWLKRSYSDDSADAIKFNSAILLPTTEGKVQLSLTNQQTDAMESRRRYVYDIEMSYHDSDTTVIERLLEGVAIVGPSATK